MNTMNTAEATQHEQGSGILSIKTLSICLGLVALAVIAVSVFKVSVGTLFFAGILLLCPLMHFFMMKDGGHKH